MLASTQYIDAGWRMYASVNWVDIDSSNGLRLCGTKPLAELNVDYFLLNS